MHTCKILAGVNSLNDFNFSYPFCNICRCKIQPIAFDPCRWKCTRNGHIQQECDNQYCYRLCLSITDSRHVCDVTVFGESVEEIFGDTATNMKGYLRHLDGSLQGLELSSDELLREAMLMSMSGKTFSFEFSLPSNNSASREEDVTLDLLKSVLKNRIIARTISSVTNKANFFTVRKGIELLMKKFLSDSRNGPGFHFSLGDNVDSSVISNVSSNDGSASQGSTDIAESSERYLLMDVWMIPNDESSTKSLTNEEHNVCTISFSNASGDMAERSKLEETNSTVVSQSSDDIFVTSHFCQLSITDHDTSDNNSISSAFANKCTGGEEVASEESCFTDTLYKSIHKSALELTSTPIAYRLRQKPDQKFPD